MGIPREEALPAWNRVSSDLSEPIVSQWAQEFPLLLCWGYLSRVSYYALPLCHQGHSLKIRPVQQNELTQKVQRTLSVCAPQIISNQASYQPHWQEAGMENYRMKLIFFQCPSTTLLPPPEKHQDPLVPTIESVDSTYYLFSTFSVLPQGQMVVWTDGC